MTFMKKRSFNINWLAIITILVGIIWLNVMVMFLYISSGIGAFSDNTTSSFEHSGTFQTNHNNTTIAMREERLDKS